jgi:hypothetical protein
MERKLHYVAHNDVCLEQAGSLKAFDDFICTEPLLDCCNSCDLFIRQTILQLSGIVPLLAATTTSLASHVIHDEWSLRAVKYDLHRNWLLLRRLDKVPSDNYLLLVFTTHIFSFT